MSWHQWSVKSSGIDPGTGIDDGGSEVLQDEWLELHAVTDRPNDKSLFSLSLDTQQVIDTTVKHCIKFVNHGFMVPNSVFIIHGQRFACEKLEYSITSKGVSPIVTGYFYRLS